MTQLTQEYLEEMGFTLSWSKNHNFKAQYAKYNSDVTSGIILVSQTESIQSLQGVPDSVFDVWFFGPCTETLYGEVCSSVVVSSVEELDNILKLWKTTEKK